MATSLATPVEAPARTQSPANGTLAVPRNAQIHDVANPDWNGSDVGRHVKHTPTAWKDKSGQSLFLKQKMDLSDVNQECVGDCWYLAALVSIINHPQGSELIKGTMVDQGNGSAVVRMYSGELSPIYLRVRKSVAWFLGFGKIHASGLSRTGLWPAILEKAASCFKKEDRGLCDPSAPHYLNLEGGQSHEAYRMLLGKPVSSEPIAGLDVRGDSHGNQNSGAHLELLFTTGNWSLPIVGKDERDALNAVFGWRGMSVERWKEIIRELKKGKSVLVFGAPGFKIGSAGYGENFFQLMNSPGLTGLPADAGQQLAAYARQHNIFAGALGSGQYSYSLLHLFQKVKGHLARGGLMSFGTKENLGALDRRGHSAGEAISTGMVGKHAYAVLDTFEETIGQRLKYVKVANPWGRTGRVYRNGPTHGMLTAHEQASGIFWLELSDFGRVVANLYMCSNPAG